MNNEIAVRLLDGFELNRQLEKLSVGCLVQTLQEYVRQLGSDLNEDEEETDEDKQQRVQTLLDTARVGRCTFDTSLANGQLGCRGLSNTMFLISPDVTFGTLVQHFR